MHFNDDDRFILTKGIAIEVKGFDDDDDENISEGIT